jgi:hypothetical protein
MTRCIAYHTNTRKRCRGRGTAPLYLCRRHQRGLVLPASALLTNPAALRELAHRPWTKVDQL